jgi:hypothetical protein
MSIKFYVLSAFYSRSGSREEKPLTFNERSAEVIGITAAVFHEVKQEIKDVI